MSISQFHHWCTLRLTLGQILADKALKRSTGQRQHSRPGQLQDETVHYKRAGAVLFFGKRTLVNLRFEALRMRQNQLVPLLQRVSTPLGEPSALPPGGQHVPLPDVLLEQQEDSGILLGALLVGFLPDGPLAVAAQVAVTCLLPGVLPSRPHVMTHMHRIQCRRCILHCSLAMHLLHHESTSAQPSAT